jgi:hypothetical protein
MSAIFRRSAEREVIREWNALPAAKRRTEDQASIFALKIRDKYPFAYRGDRYYAILVAIMEHQFLKGAPLDCEPTKSRV